MRYEFKCQIHTVVLAGLTSIVAMTLTGCTTSGTVPNVQPSHIIADTKGADVGTVTRGDVVRHTFRLTNSRPEPIRIEAVTPGCGGKASTSAMRINQGATVDLSVEFDTRHVRSGSPVELPTRLMTLEPEPREFTISLWVTVLEEFVLSNTAVDLGSGPQGRAQAYELTLSLRPPHRFQITSIRSTDESVAAQVRRLTTASATDEYVVSVAEKSDARVGSHFGALILDTSSDITPSIRIPVRGRVTTRANETVQ